MYIHGSPVLNILDSATIFSTAIFLAQKEEQYEPQLLFLC